MLQGNIQKLIKIGKAPAIFTPSSQIWLLKGCNLKVKLRSWTLKFCPSMWTWYQYAGAMGRHVHVCQDNSFGWKTEVLNRIPYSGFVTWSKYNLPLSLTRKEWESIWDLGWKESCAYIRKKQRSGTNVEFVQVWVLPISDSAWGWGPSRSGEMIC